MTKHRYDARNPLKGFGETPQRGIRRYGPGKFDNIIDGYVYELSMDGSWGEQAGDSGTSGFYASVRLGRNGLKAILENMKDQGDKPTLAEAKLVRSSYGAVCREGDQGFVSCEYYDTKAELEKDWKKVEAHVAEFSEGEDY